VPSIVLHGADDPMFARRADGEMDQFPAGTERRIIPGAGHFMPREKPAAVVDAFRTVLK
jgi:pimeloyl-ACP methyl ester carboxylesterase